MDTNGVLNKPQEPADKCHNKLTHIIINLLISNRTKQRRIYDACEQRHRLKFMTPLNRGIT